VPVWAGFWRYCGQKGKGGSCKNQRVKNLCPGWWRGWQARHMQKPFTGQQLISLIPRRILTKIKTNRLKGNDILLAAFVAGSWRSLQKRYRRRKSLQAIREPSSNAPRPFATKKKGKPYLGKSHVRGWTRNELSTVLAESTRNVSKKKRKARWKRLIIYQCKVSWGGDVSRGGGVRFTAI